MSTISILKIETNDKVALISNDAIQELFPSHKGEILRNVALEPLVHHACVPYRRCTIETTDAPDLDALTSGQLCKIYSILTFKKYDDTSVPHTDYVEDSFQRHDGYVIFRPILHMHLLDFKCKNNNVGKTVWRLEFEDG
jgi:hypothetical protein